VTYTVVRLSDHSDRTDLMVVMSQAIELAIGQLLTELHEQLIELFLTADSSAGQSN